MGTMHRTKPATVILVLLLASVVAATALAQKTGGTVQVRVQARIEYDKAVSFITIRFPNPVSRVALNATGIADRVLATYVTLENGVVKGEVRGGQLVYALPSPMESVNITTVYGKAVKVSGDTVYYEIPVTLSPIGYNATVTGNVDFRNPRVRVEKPPYGTVRQGTVSFNNTVPQGTTIVLRGNVSARLVSVSRLESIDRTIILHKDKVEVVDNITLVLLTDNPARGLGLRIPGYVKIEKIEGPLGFYPSRYWKTYKAGQYRLLTISLRAPPWGRGQKTSVKIYAVLNYTGSQIDPFFGYGVYIPTDNYSVKICIRGEASIDYPVQRELREDGYTCYELKKPGPLLIEGFYKPVTVTIKRIEQPQPPYLLIAFVAALVAIAGGYAYLRSKAAPSRPKERALESLEETTVSDIERLLTRREELYRSLLERLRRMREKKVGTTKLITAIRETSKRDEAYVKKIKSLAASLGDPGRKFVSEMDRLTQRLREGFRKLERVERAFKSGRMDKKDYRKSVDEIEREIEQTLTEIAGLLRILEQ